MKKKLLAALLVVCMVAAMLVPASAATTFDDVDADAWYAGSIERWTGNGILNGKGDNKFDPTGEMKRAEFAKVIVELLGLAHDSTETPFDDVDGHWAAGHIAAAYNAGIINGKGEGKFAPEDPVTFNESAAMLARATGLVGSKAWGAEVTAKLEELGVLDDHVNADAEPNRALVAALADNLIGAYVTPDTIETETEDGVVTGTKGVILVKGDVEVKVENATVAAIVMQGGNVTLSGETTVDTVKVGGENATVTAEEGTTVGAVTVEGTDAKVELNGEVASVTVTEDAEGEIEITVPEDVEVANDSTVAVTVNGEEVEGKPAEETPDDNQGEDEEPDTTYVPAPSAPAAIETPDEDEPGTPPETAKKDEDGNDIPVCGATDEDGELVEGAAASHTWVLAEEQSSPATCTEKGDADYECSVCGATTTVEEGIPALGHNQVNIPAVPATCTEKGTAAGIGCDRCATKDEDGNVTEYTHIESGCAEVAELGHAWQKVTTTADEVTTTVYKCTRTGCEKNTEPETECPVHATVAAGATCTLCGLKKEGGSAPVTPEHTHSWNTQAWGGKNADGHWHLCTAENCTVTVTATNPGNDAAKALNGWVAHTGDNALTAINTTATDATAPTEDGHLMTCTTCGYVSTNRSQHTVVNWSAVKDGDDVVTGYEGTCTGCSFKVTQTEKPDGFVE